MEVDLPDFIEFIVENVSKMKLEEPVFSQPLTIKGLPWRSLVMKKQKDGKDYLGFFIECNRESESSSWTCLASATLTLLSQAGDMQHLSRKITHVFNYQDPDWGFSCFKLWSDVLNPECGFIKNGTIVVTADIAAHAPTGVYNIPREPGLDIILDAEQERDIDRLILMNEENEARIQSFQARVVCLEDDLAIAQSEIKTSSEMLNEKSEELLSCRDTITILKSRIDILEEMLKSKFEELDKKFNGFSHQNGKEERA